MFFIIISIIVISIVGTLLHFVYDFTKHNKIVGLFGAVNESTWEHIKIALTPTIIWGVIDGYIYGGTSNYFFAKLMSLLTIIFLIPLLFYGYRYLFKRDNTFFNILVFYVAIVCSQLLFGFLISYDSIGYFLRYVSCLGTYIVFACYLLFTVMPIKNFLFKDPISNKYGFKGHS